jgi:cytochrome c oxidase cbb3-type subunit 3
MKRILTLLVLSFVFSNGVTAQATTAEQGLNFMEVFLAGVALVLIFVIWGLGSILIAFAKQVLEKQQKERGKTAAMIAVFLLLSVASFAQTDPAAAVAAPVANYGGVSATTFFMLVGVIAAEFLIIFIMVFNIRRLYAELQPKKETAPVAIAEEKESWALRTWHMLDKKFFTKAADKEADVMLDHDYDGIRELDNALPPWWKYGFYITIALAVVYLLRFHVMDAGPNPEQEYAAEMQKAQLQMEAYMAKAKDLVDENNVQYDPSGLAVGKELYIKSCVACHGQLGEGGVGPNLTDEYWLHGGSMGNIFKTIKYGYPDKGMQSWQQQFSPKQIQHLSSFVESLKGTNPPNGKAPQGDLYKAEPVIADSTAAASKPVAIN